MEALRQKGWSEEELAHLQQHYNPPKESPAVLVVLIAFLMFAAIGVPAAYFYVAHELPLFIIFMVLIFIGLPLGAIFGILLLDVTWFRDHHYKLLVAIPAAIILVCAFVLASLMNLIISNALIGGVLYALSFTMAYGYLVITGWTSQSGQLSS